MITQKSKNELIHAGSRRWIRGSRKWNHCSGSQPQQPLLVPITDLSPLSTAACTTTTTSHEPHDQFPPPHSSPSSAVKTTIPTHPLTHPQCYTKQPHLTMPKTSNRSLTTTLTTTFTSSSATYKTNRLPSVKPSLAQYLIT